MSFGGRATPVRYSGGEFERTATPAQSAPVLPPPATRKVGGDEHKQALYRLLGQDLDICVEAHADAYEQARKKWSECSIEEWTQGADGAFIAVGSAHVLMVSLQNWRRDSARCSTSYVRSYSTCRFILTSASQVKDNVS